MINNTGHRKRLREKYKRSELRSFHDYEIIEMLLYYTNPRGDTKPIAKAITKKFSNIQTFLNASELELQSIKGIGESTTLFLKLIKDLYSRALLPIEGKEIILNSWSSVFSFCRFTMSHLKNEELRIFFLNKRNALIRDEIFSRGTVDQVQLIPRELVKRALEIGAVAIILAHNHPSNDLRPSHEDIEVTKLIKSALETVDIKVLDHLIIADNDCFSFKSNMLI